MDPKNCRTFVGFFGVGHSMTAVSFFGSMWRVLCPTITSRYSISSFSNSHFSGLRYRLFCLSMSSTWCVYCQCLFQCSSSVSPCFGFMWIVMLSMYTDSHPRATSFRKIVFIIIWNVAGELVSPKNMTVGLNRPSGVRKATFHSSPGLI